MENLEDMVFDLLTEWHRANQHGLPEIIIFYRDGVGEGQLQVLLDTEVKALKDAARQAAAELTSIHSYPAKVVASWQVSTSRGSATLKFDSPTACPTMSLLEESSTTFGSHKSR